MVLNHFISRCIAEERWIPFRALLMRARVSASVHGAAILKLMRTQHVVRASARLRAGRRHARVPKHTRAY